MEDANIYMVIERLNKIEKKNKRLRLVNCILLVAILAGGLISFQVSNQFFKVIETEKLVLKDSQGRERAVLLIDTSNNSPKLRFKDEEGEVLNSIGINDSLPYIRFFKNEKNCLLNITLRKDNYNPFIQLQDYTSDKKEDIDYHLIRSGGSYIHLVNDGSITIGRKKMYVRGVKGWIELFVTGRNGIELSDKNEKVKLCIGKNEDGFPYIIMNGNNDSLKTILYNEGLRFNDNNSNCRIHIGLDNTSKPSISLYDAYERIRTIIGCTSTNDQNGRTTYHPESSIWLFNEYGNGVFSAPGE